MTRTAPMTTRPPDLILEIQHASKIYATGGVPVTALEGVELEVRQGEFLGITGKSGAGKTTLLNVMTGISALTAGSILFYPAPASAAAAPLPIHRLNEDQLALWRGQNIGIVYQSFELMPGLSLLENVMLPPDFSNCYHPVATRRRALELLERVEIAGHADKLPAQISGGQKQRLAIARALVNEPRLIVADEPTGSLDSQTAKTILQIFEQLVAQGRTIVMVTHDESFVPRFSRHLQIQDGILSRPAPVALPLPPAAPAVSAPPAPPVVLALPPAAPADGVRPAAAPAVVLQEVDKVYENAAGRFVALKKVNLQLEYGRFISIVGKSGSGKSTLLNMITGIDHPSAGEVRVAGEPIYRLSESRRAQWRGRNLGVVFQFFQLLPTLTLLENVMLPMDYCRVYPPRQRRGRALELLELVGVADQAGRLPGAVSNGQQQSAAIGRALATDPAILVADEPTGNLDSRAAEKILNLFQDLARRGKTIVIVTHDPAIARRTDQTITLADGEIVAAPPGRARSAPLPDLDRAP